MNNDFTLHPSVLDPYKQCVHEIQKQLSSQSASIDSFPITQSLIELWKLVYEKFSLLIEVQIPDYPTYKREAIDCVVSISSLTDWTLIEQIDYEYFRVVEYFATKNPTSKRFKIDLSFYDVNDGIYWRDIPPERVVKVVE